MICFVGPLPPPLHGFSNINLQMLRHLQNKTSVRVFDNARPSPSKNSFKQRFFLLFRSLRLIGSFLIICLMNCPNSLYLGLSGGLGQIGDAVYLSIARIFNIEIFIHHHSFAYLSKPKLYNRVCMWLVKRSHHIVLCDQMADRLCSLYNLERRKLFVLSNSAFLENPPKVIDSSKVRDGSITVGFLSNITLEKGIMEFFDVVDHLLCKGLPIKALIAGPIAPEIQDYFMTRLAGCKAAKYLGPVYDKEKDEFFDAIDMLLFPTKYKNEAEPVTILEALRYGVPVIAAGRGCIFSMIDQRCGKVFAENDEFVSGSVEYIQRVLDGDIVFEKLSEAAYQKFSAVWTVQVAQLASLIGKISGQENKFLSL